MASVADIAGSVSSGAGLKQLSRAERDDAPACNKDVIKNADTQELADFDESPGDGEVLFRGFGVARRVVVNEHDRCCRAHDSGQEHFAGMDNGSVQRSDRDGHLGHELMAGIEKQHQEVLTSLSWELRP